MIRAAALALLLAGPVGAEGLAGQALCASAWGKLATLANGIGSLAGTVGQDGDWCVVDAPVLDMVGQYVPDWHMGQLRFRGSALGWIADGLTLPEGLEVSVEGLRLVVQTGNPQMDWLFAAQSRPNAINADLALSWDPSTKALRIERLSVDFPGENLVEASGVVTGVDLSSTGAAQMSATGFALTEARVEVQTHGLFEGYALMALGPALLPSEGDMDAAFAGLKAGMKSVVGALPGASVPDDSKAALVALVDELPNPSGDLTLRLTADPGLGPVRLGGMAIFGVQDLADDLRPLFQGVTLDVEWTHADAP